MLNLLPRMRRLPGYHPCVGKSTVIIVVVPPTTTETRHAHFQSGHISTHFHLKRVVATATATDLGTLRARPRGQHIYRHKTSHTPHNFLRRVHESLVRIEMYCWSRTRALCFARISSPRSTTQTHTKTGQDKRIFRCMSSWHSK